MKYGIVILPLVLSALKVLAIKLEHVSMVKMIFDVQLKN